MDQLSFYEAQCGQAKPDSGDTYVLQGRDSFVVEYINKSVLPGREGRLEVAELSIGDGKLSRAILQANSAIALTCVDISPSRIRLVSDLLASEALLARSRFVECNFDTHFALLAENAFDVVIALDVMEHVFDVFNFVEHCRRILRSNGALILRVPNVAYIKHRLKLLAGKLPVTASWFGMPEDLSEWRKSWGWDGGHLHLFTIPILVKLLRESGFSVEQCCDPGSRLSTLRNLWPNLLYSNPLIIAKKWSSS